VANDAKSIPSFLVRAHPKPAGIIHGRTFSLHFQLPKNLYVWICWVKLGPREILLYIYILFCHCLRQRWLRPGMGTRFSGGFQPVPVEKLRFFPGSTGKYAGGSGRLLRFSPVVRFRLNRRTGCPSLATTFPFIYIPHFSTMDYYNLTRTLIRSNIYCI